MHVPHQRPHHRCECNMLHDVCSLLLCRASGQWAGGECPQGRWQVPESSCACDGDGSGPPCWPACAKKEPQPSDASAVKGAGQAADVHCARRVTPL